MKTTNIFDVILLTPFIIPGYWYVLSPTRKETSCSDQTLNFASHQKKNQEVCPPNQVSAAAMTSASDEKWRPFNCFFSRVGLRTYQHPCINTFEETVIEKEWYTFCKHTNLIHNSLNKTASIWSKLRYKIASVATFVPQLDKDVLRYFLPQTLWTNFTEQTLS